MKFQFLNSSLLWLLPVLAVAWLGTSALKRIQMRGANGIAAAKRLRPSVLLQAAAAMCLILAAAGLQYRHAARKIQLVVAADVSPSIYETNAQTERIRDMLAALDPETTEYALVVFSETAGLERSMGPLPSPSAAGAQGSQATIKTLPDLSRLNAVIKTDGTDIGAALQYARGAFTSADCSRGILLLSDFRDTHMLNDRSASRSAAFLQGSGIDLLTTPAILGPNSDVQLAEFRVPGSGSTERALPLEITIAAQQPATVTVTVRRQALGRQPVFVASKTVRLDAGKDGAELRATVRLFDHPAAPGTAVYTATLSGPDGPIPGDVLLNNSLSAAVPVAGPSKWAVVARRESTLARLAADRSKPLGAETQLFPPDQMPGSPQAYEPFAGILVDGLSADELPDTGAALRALGQAVDQGKALIAIGGEAAFGAGGHPRDGAWEKLLPIEMTPEDDRARAVLFIIDVSKSMDDKIVHGGQRVRKMDFAADQLQAVNVLRPQDRLGLITFSGRAKLAAPLENDSAHAAFLNAVHGIRIDSKTDFLPALELAKQTLEADDAEEQIVILISDGVDTSGRNPEEIIRAAEKLSAEKAGSSARRTTVWTFGIGVGKEDVNATGEELLVKFAAVGGGKYSSDFKNLGTMLKTTLEQGKKEFYTRREPFVPRPGQPHALVQNGAAWPLLNFRNRVKSRSGADTVLVSGVSKTEAGAKKPRVDPILVLSGPGISTLARRAALALNPDGEEGAKLLAPGSAGRTLLPALLSWAEARGEHNAPGVSLSAEPFGNDALAIELRAFDVLTGEPENTLNPSALLTVLQTADNESGGEAERAPLALRASAPGTYRGTTRAPSAAVCRLSVREGGRTIAEQFVSTPCAAEMRRFGVDRAAMAELLSQAGPESQAIESPRDLAQWAAGKTNASGVYDLRGWLLGVALGLLLLEYGLRGKTRTV